MSLVVNWLLPLKCCWSLVIWSLGFAIFFYDLSRKLQNLIIGSKSRKVPKIRLGFLVGVEFQFGQGLLNAIFNN
jgi:hypothetical protein